MRKTVLARLVFALSAVGGIGAWVACGGSDNQDVTQSDAGRDTGGPPEEEEPIVQPEPEDSGVDATPTGRDAGAPTILYPDGGDFAEAGIECFSGGVLEIEPNDTRATATEFPVGVDEGKVLRRVLCGYIKGSDGGFDAGESDWLKFQISDASTGFYIEYHGNLKVSVETDGQAPVDITNPDASLIRRYGQPYLVDVRSASGETRQWKIVVYEERNE